MVGYTALMQADERLARDRRDRYMSARQQTLRATIDSDKTPGREFVDRGRAALSADEVARATEAGSRLTIRQAVDLARTPETTAA